MTRPLKPGTDRRQINQGAGRIRNLERRFIAAGALSVDRCGHYDVVTVAASSNGQIIWGPPGMGDPDHGAAFLDFSTVAPTVPIVLADGWYSATVWANLTPGQGSFSEFGKLAVDFDNHGGDNNDLVQAFPLQNGYGTAVVTVPPCFIAAGHGFDAAIKHQHASSLDFQTFVFVQHLA